jgi:hypothetical protein
MNVRLSENFFEQGTMLRGSRLSVDT